MKLSKPKRDALKAYRFAVQQEDRYMGSVFVTSSGQREHEAKVATAYNRCKSLGMGYMDGL